MFDTHDIDSKIVKNYHVLWRMKCVAGPADISFLKNDSRLIEQLACHLSNKNHKSEVWL